MNAIKYLILGMFLMGATSIFCAEPIVVPKTPKELRDALHAAKTVEEAQRLIDLKADVRVPAINSFGNTMSYNTLLYSVALNFENDPELINFVVSRGITTEWAQREVDTERNFENISPLLYFFVLMNSDAIQNRPLGELRNRLKRLMEAGVLTSSPYVTEINKKRNMFNTGCFTGALKQEIDLSFRVSGGVSAKRYIVTLAQTVDETGRALSVKRGLVKLKLLDVLPSISKDIINEIFEYLYPHAIFDIENAELAKVKALLDDERVQKFLEEDEFCQKTDGEKS